MVGPTVPVPPALNKSTKYKAKSSLNHFTEILFKLLMILLMSGHQLILLHGILSYGIGLND